MSKFPRYMMATKAIHQLGDISSEVPDICLVRRETETDYIGEWVTGFGFIDVRFPKATTRELTEDEHNRFNGSRYQIGSGPVFEIRTKD